MSELEEFSRKAEQLLASQTQAAYLAASTVEDNPSMPRTASLTGAAGVYYVAAKLNAIGLHCAPTFGSVPNIDILVSNLDGSKAITLQVKTTEYAVRSRGRGAEKKPHHCEWAIGWNCAQLDAKDIFFALVDLKGLRELPDVYIVPSAVVAEYFRHGIREWYGGVKENWKWPRYHPELEDIETYKNAWSLLEAAVNLNQPYS